MKPLKMPTSSILSSLLLLVNNSNCVEAECHLKSIVGRLFKVQFQVSNPIQCSGIEITVQVFLISKKKYYVEISF